MQRRQFLRRVAAVGVGLTVAGQATGAPDYQHYDEQPDHVELIYDQAMLEKYQPALVTDHLDVEPTALWGWRAASSTRTIDVLVYWAGYTHQDGISPFAQYLSDSHYGDHEPVYVEVDATDGSIKRIQFSAYHWLRGSTTTPPLTDDGRPKLHVVNPWHQYRPAPEARETDLETVGLRDLTEKYPYWLDNGMAEDIRPGASTNPWIMRDHASWWRPSSRFGMAINHRQRLASLGYQLGVAGADSSEVE